MRSLVALFAVGWSLAATAQPSVILPDLPVTETGAMSPEAKDAARLAREAFDQSRRDDALKHGARVWEIRPNASTALFYATILGDYQKACEALHLLLVAADLDPTAAERSAIDRALSKASARCDGGYGTLRLLVTAPEEARIEVSGTAVPSGRMVGLAAGRHEVIVRADGFRTRTETVTVRPGDTGTQRYQLSPGSDASPDAQPPAEEIEAGGVEQSDGDGWRTPTGATLTAVGGVAIVTGVVLFIQAVGKRDEANDSALAPEGGAANDSADRLERYNALVGDMETFQTVAWVAVGAGAAALAGGLVVLLMDGDESAPTTGVQVSPTGATFVFGGRF